uniref:Uncharacterized protein n=1 Tax=Manihot esculenta TaxID=3983 RepID=A0A2C9V318_MANES
MAGLIVVILSVCACIMVAVHFFVILLFRTLSCSVCRVLLSMVFMWQFIWLYSYCKTLITESFCSTNFNVLIYSLLSRNKILEEIDTLQIPP